MISALLLFLILINFMIRAGTTKKKVTVLQEDVAIELEEILLNRCPNHRQIPIRTTKISTARQLAEPGLIGVLIREKVVNPKTKIQLVER